MLALERIRRRRASDEESDQSPPSLFPDIESSPMHRGEPGEGRFWPDVCCVLRIFVTKSPEVRAREMFSVLNTGDTEALYEGCTPTLV